MLSWKYHRGDTTMNRTILNLHMKSGEEQLIECEWFTMTSVNTLVITKINENDGSYEKIYLEMDDVEWFGGWGN